LEVGGTLFQYIIAVIAVIGSGSVAVQYNAWSGSNSRTKRRLIASVVGGVGDVGGAGDASDITGARQREILGSY
jgi:hypothetical protein